MNVSEYQKLASRTINTKLSRGELIRHSLYGMCSEVGELHGIYQKAYQGHAIDVSHALKELGDLMWFIAEYCTANQVDLEYVMQENIDKLKARYPEGFDKDKSLNRREGDI